MMLTEPLARFALRRDPVPPHVLHEAKRSALNVIAAAVGAAESEPVRIVLDWVRGNAARGPARVWGHAEAFVPSAAALVNGTMSHVLDYDDTHPGTLIHVTSPVLPPALHIAEARGLSGLALLEAFAVGAEVALRIGAVVFPSHYDRGYHITATAGTIGAAAAAGRALGLDPAQMRYALGIAATLSGGLREMFGSHCKPFQVGHAGRTGVMAAELALGGMTAAETSLEGAAGWTRAVADGVDPGALATLGERWDFAGNTYKPWACGLVAQPVVDAVIELRRRHAIALDEVVAIELTVPPRALELCGKRSPVTGLEGKFSVYHAAAVGFVDGAGGEAQFTDARVADATVRRLRARVTAVVDPLLDNDQSHVVVRVTDGRRLEHRVEHALGSPANPLTDAMLEDKYRAAADGIVPTARQAEVVSLIWNLHAAPDARALGRLLARGEPA